MKCKTTKTKLYYFEGNYVNGAYLYKSKNSSLDKPRWRKCCLTINIGMVLKCDWKVIGLLKSFLVQCSWPPDVRVFLHPIWIKNILYFFVSILFRVAISGHSRYIYVACCSGKVLVTDNIRKVFPVLKQLVQIWWFEDSVVLSTLYFPSKLF